MTTNKLPGPLPPDILLDILTANMARPATCALALLCPDWTLCDHPNPNSNSNSNPNSHRARARALEAVLRTTRVDTYTLPFSPSSSQRGGEVVTAFDHGHGHGHGGGAQLGGGCSHGLCVPVMADPRPREEMMRGEAGMGLGLFPGWLQRELVGRWAARGVYVAGQRGKEEVVAGLAGGSSGEVAVGATGGRRRPVGLVLLRAEGAVGMLPYEDDRVNGKGRVWGVGGREKDRLGGEGERGYLFRRVRHLVVNCDMELAGVEATDLAVLPLNFGREVARELRILAERLEYERRAQFLVRWEAMERLETLCLDLRGYSSPWNRYLDEEDVVQLARSLDGKGLEVLVIAGLRSWALYPGPDELEIAEVEGGIWDPQKKAWMCETGRMAYNWWKLFGKAVRPGGRLVLVDKEDDQEVRLLRPDAHHMGMAHH